MFIRCLILPSCSFLFLRNFRRLFLLGGPKLSDSGMAHIAAMKRLEWLTIREGRIGSQTISAVCQLKYLAALTISSVVQIPSESFLLFSALSHLQHLVLSDCKTFPNAAITSVSHVSVEKLVITNAHLISRVETLSICTNLKYLNLSFSSLSDSALKSLSTLCQLEELSLDGLQLTGEGFSFAMYSNSLKSFSMRYNCKEGKVSDCKITREGAEAIARFTK